jgi:hypothetical protein
VRYSCAAQSVIRQAADTFATGRFGGLEFWRGCRFCYATKDAPLRNKGFAGCARCLAESRKLQGKKCASFGREVCAFQVRDAHCLGMK